MVLFNNLLLLSCYIYSVNSIVITKALKRQCHCDFPGDPECPPVMDITVAIPEQHLTVEVHTGHTVAENVIFYKNYDKEKSTTFKNVSSTAELGFTTAEALHLGDKLLRNFTFVHAIGKEMNRVVDGVMGFDFMEKDGSLSATPTQLLAHFTEPKFTVYFKPKYDRSQSIMGQLTLGAIDLVNCGPVDMWVHPLPPETADWMVPVKGFAIGDDTYDIVDKAVIQIERDNIEVPSRIFRVIMLKTGARRKKFRFRRGLEQHVVDCQKRETGPVLYFSIEDKEFAIPPDQYILETGFGDGCALAVTTSKSKTKQIRLGRPFLRQYCTVFDYEGRLGFTEREYSSKEDSSESREQGSGVHEIDNKP